MRPSRFTIAAFCAVMLTAPAALGQVQIQMPAPPRPAYTPLRPPASPSTVAPAPREATVGDVALYRYSQVRQSPRETYGPRYVDVYARQWGQWGHWWGWPSWRIIGPPLIVCPSHTFGGFSSISIFGVN